MRVNLREIGVIHHEVFLEQRLVGEGFPAGGAVGGAVEDAGVLAQVALQVRLVAEGALAVRAEQHRELVVEPVLPHDVPARGTNETNAH